MPVKELFNFKCSRLTENGPILCLFQQTPRAMTLGVVPEVFRCSFVYREGTRRRQRRGWFAYSR